MKDLRGKFPWTHHGEYFEVALEHYEAAAKLEKELDSFVKHKRGMSDRDVDFVAEKNDAIGKHALRAVIFSALSLEAFINHYAIDGLSRRYLTNYLDKLDLLAKWIIIPRIVTGRQLDPGAEPVQHLSWLITLRNRLVHYKAKNVTIEEIKQTDFLSESDAEKAIRTVRDIVSALRQIDNKVDTSWLK